MDWRGWGKGDGWRKRKGREGDRDPEGGSRGEAPLSGARELRSPWEDPLPTLSALPATPPPDPAPTFWKFGGNAPSFFIKYFTGHCAGCWGHSQTEPHVTPTLQRLLGKEEASSSDTGGKKRAGGAGARTRSPRSWTERAWQPLPLSSPSDSPEPIAGPSGQEVGGPPVPVMLLRRGRGGGPGGRCTRPWDLGPRQLKPVVPPHLPGVKGTLPHWTLCCVLPAPPPPGQLTPSTVPRVCSHQTLTPCATRLVNGGAGGQGHPSLPHGLSKARPLGLFGSRRA